MILDRKRSARLSGPFCFYSIFNRLDCRKRTFFENTIFAIFFVLTLSADGDSAVFGDGYGVASVDCFKKFVAELVDCNDVGIFPNLCKHDSACRQRVDVIRKQERRGIDAHRAYRLNDKTARRRTYRLRKAKSLARDVESEDVLVVLIADDNLFCICERALLECRKSVHALS